MLYNYRKLLVTFFILILITSCNGGEMTEKPTEFSSIKDIPTSAWERLAQKKIYFGHQSVGNNIIEGIQDLMKEHPEIKLNIVKTIDPVDFKGGIFAHSSIGKNDAPKSKIDAFADYMKKGIGNKSDIAFFKFCFADIIGTTDVNDVFRSYRNTMSELKELYPKTTFVHVTVPLVTTNKSIKAWIKRMLGRKDIWFYDGNIKRNELNRLILDEYSGSEPVFDLAEVESTYPNGRREIFKEGSNVYYAMVPEFTKDAGHLNEEGRGRAAEQLLILLASLSKQGK